MATTYGQAARNLSATSSRLATKGSALDKLLGIGEQGPVRSLNLVRRDATGRVMSAGEIAGQRNPWDSVSAEDRQTVSNFFSPALDTRGQQVVKDIGTYAAAAGLYGNAVRSRVEDAAVVETARSRAGSAGRTSEILRQFAQNAGNQSANFLQSVGIMRNTLGTAMALYPSAGDRFEPFAQEALDALNAVGLGGEGIAGLARARGVHVRGEGTQGVDAYGEAYAEYLNPRNVSGYQETHGGAAYRKYRNIGLNLVGKAENRIGAGEMLAGEVGRRVQGMQSAANELGALAGADLSVMGLSGDVASARRFIERDYSKYQNAFTTPFGLSFLGRDVNPNAAKPRAGGFLPGNAMFASLFGA